MNPDVSIARLARITEDTGGYPKGSILPATTLGGLLAFHVRGWVVGDDTEEFGTVHDGNIVAVEFNFKAGLEEGRRELIDSVLATVEFR